MNGVFWADQISYHRENRPILDAIGIRVHPGEFILLTGSNGSGKSTLLKILSGLVQPQAGRVFFKGKPIRGSWSTYCQQRVYLGHKNGLQLALKARDQFNRFCLDYPCCQLDENAFKRLWAHWQLPEFGCYQTLSQLSQGQRRKVALMIHLQTKIPLWLLDEPEAGLDAASLDILREQVTQHLNQGGMAVIASHQRLWKNAQTIDLSNRLGTC